MTPIALALSPHLDDAVFSAGGTLHDLAMRGFRVVVATMFTASVVDPKGFALACQLDKGLPADVDYMALRRAEDAAACAILGAEPLWLPFPEAPHRGYHSAPALFAGLREADGIIDAIVPALRSLFDTLRPTLVLAPQAIGGHVDHEAVVRGLDRIAWPGLVAWWHDYPYTVRGDAPYQPFNTRFGELNDVLLPMTPEAGAAKLQAALAYHSQLGFQFGGAEALAVTLHEAPLAETFRSTVDAQQMSLWLTPLWAAQS